MYLDELKNLFSEEEFQKFLSFIQEKRYLLLGREKQYSLVEYIQEFMTSLESKRLEEIIEICANKYPQILGFGADQGA